MRKEDSILLLLYILLLTFESGCHTTSQNLISKTTERDKREYEDHVHASASFNYSFETNLKRKITELLDINPNFIINSEFKQKRRHIPMPKEGRDFIVQTKRNLITNTTGFIDYENENAVDAKFYKDEPMRSKSHEKESRLDGFTMSDPQDNPYAVMLVEFLEDHAYFGICSGSLVTLEWVLTTTSHCFSLMEVSEIEIHAGGYSKKEWTEQSFRPGHQMIRSVDYYIHPSYKEQLDFVDYYDVALVKAQNKFKSTSTVSVVKISSEPWRPKKKLKECKATGFGKVQYFEKHPDLDFVRKTHTLEVKSPCICLEQEKKPETWICAGLREDVGICGSDWGAGLICDNKLTAVASEVIAFEDYVFCKSERKPYCARFKSLSVFQNVYPCLDWINSYIGPHKREDGDRSNGQNRSRFSFFVVLICTIFTQS